MSRATLICGDVREVLSTHQDGVFQCCVTSPPYWGLRDYGIRPSVWAGDPNCPHQWDTTQIATEIGKGSWAQGTNGRGERQPGGIDAKREPIPATAERAFCARCGAWRGALGLEPTPELYLEHVVAVFREVRRVLRDDGTLWLNLGDSYAGSWGAQSRPNGNDLKSNLEGGSPLWARQIMAAPKGTQTGSLKRTPGLKAKDLVGIPWRVAFALQADGWWLRSDIIWAKPNPMPESVTDRPTKAHEYVFLLSKSAQYYYNASAIRTPAKSETTKMPDGWDTGDGAHGSYHRNGREKGRRTDKQIALGANARTVWEIATQPYAGAHFATFPEELARRCVLAGSRPGDSVLDPFGGSGTVAHVALELGRESLYIDLNPAYVDLAERRLEPLFVTRA